MYGRSASVSGVPYPRTRSTFSSSTNFLYAATARGGWKPYSTLTSSIFLPWMPPLSLNHCTASLRPLAMSLPWSEVGPVRSTRLPSLMGAWASAGAAAMPTATRPTRRNWTSGPSARLIASSFGEGSIRVRPQLPVAAEAHPDAREPQGLIHQEEDHGEAEHDVPHGGDEAEGLRVNPGERGGGELQHLGQERHEDRPEDGADNAAHAADDDHRQVVDGHEQGEGVGEEDARVMRHEPPRHARVERADDEGEELVAQQAHAHHASRHVAVAHRDEGPAHPGAEEVLGEEDRGN